MVRDCHTGIPAVLCRTRWASCETAPGRAQKVRSSDRRIELLQRKKLGSTAVICVVLLVAGCGASPTSTSGSQTYQGNLTAREQRDAQETTIWEAFAANRNAENTVQVNKYLWSASLDVLDFLPVESVDPFTGVIVTGFGTPPGGSRAYRATILIDDPALDARALNVSLQTRNAPADPATVRAVEDAILTRARQLRIADERL